MHTTLKDFYFENIVFLSYKTIIKIIKVTSEIRKQLREVWDKEVKYTQLWTEKKTNL